MSEEQPVGPGLFGTQEDKAERRQDYRLQKLLTAELVQNNNGSEPVRLYVMDISLSGLRVTIDRRLSDPNVELKLFLERHLDPIEAKVRVVWQSELSQPSMFQAGLQFVEVPSTGLERMLRFIQEVRLRRRHKSVRAETGQLRTLTEQEIDRMGILTQVSQLLNTSYEVEQVLDDVMDTMVEALEAERGFIMLDRGGPVPEVAAARGVKMSSLGTEEVWYSRKVIDKVLKEGQAVLSLDAAVDPELNTSKSLQLLGTRSIMCVPLKTRDRNVGLLYLDSSVKIGVFSSADLALARVVADLSAAAIERALYFTTMLRNETMGALGRLVAGLSHEILNPLTAIRSAGQVLERKGADPELCETVTSQADRCAELVRDLLRMARGQHTPFVRVELREVLRSTLDLMAPEFRERGTGLAADLPDQLPAVLGSADQLRQIIINLMSNALNVLDDRPDGRVLLRADVDRSLIRIQVRDNGPGIPPEHLAQIFEPFYTTRAEGTGLGLSIVHRIVVEHGGTITAHNSSSGGAAFTIELPAYKDVTPPEAPEAQTGDGRRGTGEAP